MRTPARRHRRTILRSAVLAGAAVVVLAGCVNPWRPRTTTTTTTTATTRPRPTTTATGPTTSSPTTSTPTIPAAGYYAREIQSTPAGATPWFCNAAGDGTPLSGHGNGAHTHPIYEGKTKGPISSADCATLARQLDSALAIVAGLETRAKGEAAGWKASAEYIEGLGTHHTKGAGIGAGFGNTTFDPTKPQFLIYGGNGGDAPLVGLSYGAQGATPPTAFAGDNDWWHLHKKICLDPRSGTFPPKILAGAEEIPDADCTALGGFNSPVPGGGLWLLHLWPTPPYQYKLDLFASGHNCLLATGTAASSDPCWALAHRDPSLGLPPGTGGDDHGAHGH